LRLGEELKDFLLLFACGCYFFWLFGRFFMSVVCFQEGDFFLGQFVGWGTFGVCELKGGVGRVFLVFCSWGVGFFFSFFFFLVMRFFLGRGGKEWGWEVGVPRGGGGEGLDVFLLVFVGYFFFFFFLGTRGELGVLDGGEEFVVGGGRVGSF